MEARHQPPARLQALEPGAIPGAAQDWRPVGGPEGPVGRTVGFGIRPEDVEPNPSEGGVIVGAPDLQLVLVAHEPRSVGDPCRQAPQGQADQDPAKASQQKVKPKQKTQGRVAGSWPAQEDDATQNGGGDP